MLEWQGRLGTNLLATGSEDGSRVRILEKALTFYSGLIVIKVVGCVPISKSHVYLPQPVGESVIIKGATCTYLYISNFVQLGGT